MLWKFLQVIWLGNAGFYAIIFVCTYCSYFHRGPHPRFCIWVKHALTGPGVPIVVAADFQFLQWHWTVLAPWKDLILSVLRYSVLPKGYVLVSMHLLISVSYKISAWRMDLTCVNYELTYVKSIDMCLKFFCWHEFVKKGPKKTKTKNMKMNQNFLLFTYLYSVV